MSAARPMTAPGICRVCGCTDMSRSEPRYCRGCGCAWAPAQKSSWVLLDVHSPTGLCRACAEGIKWDPQEMAFIWEIDITPEAFAAGHRPLLRRAGA